MKPAAASGRHPPPYIWMSEKHQATGSEEVAARISDPNQPSQGELCRLSYCTTWFTTDDVLFAEKASPRYWAVIGCVPTASVDLVSLATPLPFDVADPIPVVPSRNFTLPVGAGPVLVTGAVKVTACPNCEGFGLEVRVVAVAYLLTTCVTFPLLVRNMESPA